MAALKEGGKILQAIKSQLKGGILVNVSVILLPFGAKLLVHLSMQPVILSGRRFLYIQKLQAAGHISDQVKNAVVLFALVGLW